MKNNHTTGQIFTGGNLRVSLSKTLKEMADNRLFIVLDFLQKVTGKALDVVSQNNEADIAFVSNLDLDRKFLLSRRWRLSKRSPKLEDLLYGTSNAQTTVLVSFENLQHPSWAAFGAILRDSKVPRFTFFPTTVDPLGVRLPYWWNYLDWPDFPRVDANYQRYGRLYSLEKLCKPIPRTPNRLGRACWVGSYISEPRESLLRHAQSTVGLDLYGAIGEPVNGPKLAVLEKYRYAVGAENSLGIGYDSEKIPELWDSGCLPISTFLQPMSDFDPRVIGSNDPDLAHRYPLLAHPPDASQVLDYLHKLL